MTPRDYAALQRAMQMDTDTFAQWLCCGPRTAHRWLNGDQDIPRWIETFGPFLVEAATGQWGPGVQKRVLLLPRLGLQPLLPQQLRQATADATSESL
jgi:hypothetical protein